MFMCPFDRVDVKMASKRSQMLQVRWHVNFNLTKSQVVHCTDCICLPFRCRVSAGPAALAKRSGSGTFP